MAYFPTSPTTGQVVTLTSGTTFVWDGAAWNRSPNGGIGDGNARRIFTLYALATNNTAVTTYTVNYV